MPSLVQSMAWRMFVSNKGWLIINCTLETNFAEIWWKCNHYNHFQTNQNEIGNAFKIVFICDSKWIRDIKSKFMAVISVIAKLLFNRINSTATLLSSVNQRQLHVTLVWPMVSALVAGQYHLTLDCSLGIAYTRCSATPKSYKAMLYQSLLLQYLRKHANFDDICQTNVESQGHK